MVKHEYYFSGIEPGGNMVRGTVIAYTFKDAIDRLDGLSLRELIQIQAMPADAELGLPRVQPIM